MEQGVLLGFDQPLAANFAAERWNYRRTFSYRSPHFKFDGSKGQETTVASGAYLSRDRKSVLVAFPDMKPVMQMRVSWTLATASGVHFDQSGYFTPYALTPFVPASDGFEPFTVNLPPRTGVAMASTPVAAAEGQRLAELMRCVACHSSDGTTVGKVGPSWKGLFGSEVALANHTKVRADENYLLESIREPGAKFVEGFDKSETAMPSYEGVITSAQIEALILYLKSLR